MGRQVAGRLRSAAEPGPSGQELAVAAEHTCEPRAWRGRPLRAPRGGGRGPGRPLTPCSLARSITHTRALGPRRPYLRREETRGEGGINPERAKGQTRHPRPRAHTGGNRNVTQGEPGGSKVHRVRAAWTRGKPPAPETASRSGDPVARPGLPSPGVRAPGHTQGLTQRLALHPPPPPPPVLAGQSPPGAQDWLPPRAQAAVSLSGPPGLRPRADSALEGSSDPRLPAAPRSPSAPRGERPCGGTGEGREALTSRRRNAPAASSRCSCEPGPPAGEARHRRPGGAVRPT